MISARKGIYIHLMKQKQAVEEARALLSNGTNLKSTLSSSRTDDSLHMKISRQSKPAFIKVTYYMLLYFARLVNLLISRRFLDFLGVNAVLYSGKGSRYAHQMHISSTHVYTELVTFSLVEVDETMHNSVSSSYSCLLLLY